MPDDEALLEDLRQRVKTAPRLPIGANDKPKAHPPVAPDEVAEAESELGYRLPLLLRRIYLEVADGGFGPAYGIFPVRHGRAEPGQEESVVEVRSKLAVDPRWHPRLLPLCDWGGAVWSCLDCRVDDGPIVTVAGEEPFMTTGHALRSWLGAWLDGADLCDEMFERRMGRNPFTKKPIEMQGKPRGWPWA